MDNALVWWMARAVPTRLVVGYWFVCGMSAVIRARRSGLCVLLQQGVRQVTLYKGYRVHSLPPDITEEGLKNYLGYLTLPGSTS